MTRRCILGVFAHPDDETSGAGGTFTRYASENVDVYVAVATLGEEGTLGTKGQVVTREELPAVREAELRAVLKMYGAHSPFVLGYRDQQVKQADFQELVDKVGVVMAQVKPDVVITFGPRGVSDHDDHITIHKATTQAFDAYRTSAASAPRLFYVAIPQDVARQYKMELDGPEVEPTVFIDITDYKEYKIRALRMYSSQKDAQELAEMFEQASWDVETFHQAYPPVEDGQVAHGFWR